MSEENEEVKQNEETQSAENNAGAEQAQGAQAEATQADGEQAAPELTPEEKLAAKEAEFEEFKTQKKNEYLLLYADFENYKKRAFKEKTDAIFMAKKVILEDMLSVVDDFERGLKEMEKSDDEGVKSLKEGVDNIYRKFINFLSQKGVTAMDTKDKDFDTDFHEAIAMVPTPGMNNKIIDCTQKGYMLGDKVMRHAKVVVGQDPNA